MKLEHTGVDNLTGKAFPHPVIISDIGNRASQDTVYRITNQYNYGSKDVALLLALSATATPTLDYSIDPNSGYIYMWNPSVVVTPPSTTGFIDWYRVTEADRLNGYSYELLEGPRSVSQTPNSGNLAAVEGPTFSQDLPDPEGYIAVNVVAPQAYDPAGLNGPYPNRLLVADPNFVSYDTNLWKPGNIGQGRYVAAGQTVEFVETGDFLMSAMQGQIRGFIDRGILRVV